MASETPAIRSCKCGKQVSLGSLWCADCSWAKDDDDNNVNQVNGNDNNDDNDFFVKSLSKHIVNKPLSCFTKCKSCGQSYRGASCRSCADVQKHVLKQCMLCKQPSELKYCATCTQIYKQRTHSGKQCETCSKKVVNGRFCDTCKAKYQSSLPNLCQTCNKVRVAEDRYYCGNCIREYKTPRTCLSCPNKTIVGIYCEACKALYKSRNANTQ